MQLSVSLFLLLSDCVVLRDEADTEKSSDIITLRLQGKDKGSSQDFSIHKVCQWAVGLGVRIVSIICVVL